MQILHTVSGKKAKNTVYMLIQMMYWMIYCSCYGFVSYYLVEKGFGTSVVGIVTAVAGIISALGQPIVGALADKPKVGYKRPLVIILVILSVFGVILLGVSLSGFGAAICLAYGAAMLLLSLATPLVNAAGVAFPGEVNFGMARGIGSFGYAVASYLMGYLTAKLGCVVIPIFISAVSLAELIVTCIMPDKPKGEISEESAAAGEEAAGSGEAPAGNDVRTKKNFFLGRYPRFTFLWVVFIFLLIVHNLSNTYLLQILEKGGGTSYNLGIAVAIAAVVEIPMIFCYEKINRKISTQNLMVIAAASYLIKSVLQLVNTNLTAFYFIQLLQMTSWAIYASASVYFTKEIIPERDQVQAQAYMANALTIATVIGTFVGGQLIEAVNVNAMLVFQTAMALIGLVGMIAWKFKYKDNGDRK